MRFKAIREKDGIEIREKWGTKMQLEKLKSKKKNEF